MKYFIITIDIEGDNLWEYKLGDTVQTKNAGYTMLLSLLFGQKMETPLRFLI
ncbi:hypothetical protein AGMMS49938_01600 [Fibrobacterales bacterium]|nr:hypothetical protein AGMMS49938_01600 [Fibrobacterales bacterium]